jgi:hypothetical protein
MDNTIEIGDEIHGFNKKGEPRLGTRFIVTEIGDNYYAGIDFGGEVYMFEDDEDIHWEKTGRHFDIIGALKKLRDEG